jgi:hypothetical protein
MAIYRRREQTTTGLALVGGASVARIATVPVVGHVNVGVARREKATAIETGSHIHQESAKEPVTNCQYEATQADQRGARK